VSTQSIANAKNRRRGGQIRVGDSTQGSDTTHNRRKSAHRIFNVRRVDCANDDAIIDSQRGRSPLRQDFCDGLDLMLRTQDALHIAIAQRVGAELLTFGRQMANAARAPATSVVGR
jgi:hypothetical protein